MNARWERLNTELKEKDLDGILLTNSVNIFYLFGVWIQGAALFTNERKFIITSPMYREEVTGKVEGVNLVFCQSKLDEKTAQVIRKTKIDRCGFESSCLSFDRYRRIKDKFDGEFIPCPGLPGKIRQVKEEKEIRYIRKASQITRSALEYLKVTLHSGITERILAREIIYYILKEADDVGFPPIVLFGDRTSLPHGRSGEKELKDNELVLVDVGAQVNGYCADFTRTFFWGEISRKWKRVYNFVDDLKRTAINYVRPGMKCSQVDEKIREEVVEAGYEEAYLHNLGHGVGLEVHEEPYFRRGSDTVLEEGMVVTVEPGLYFPGEGGVRMEDTVLVTSQGGCILP